MFSWTHLQSGRKVIVALLLASVKHCDAESAHPSMGNRWRVPLILDFPLLARMLRAIMSFMVSSWTCGRHAPAPPADPKRGGKDPQQKRIAALEKELRRKEAALAEAAALLMLKKKADSIWGESKDER